MKLRLVLQQQQEMIASNFRYAPAFDALQQQMNEQRSHAQGAEKVRLLLAMSASGTQKSTL
jgi:hypothetical protein